MKLFCAVVLGAFAVVSMGFLAVQRTPTTKIETFNVSINRPETRTRTVRQTIDFHGEKVAVDVEVPYTVNVPSSEERATIHTSLQKLQFWFILAVGFFFGTYLIFVLALWVRDKLARVRTA